MTSGPISPHGGELVDRVVHGPRRERMLARAAHLPRLTLSHMSISDLEMIAVGAYSPLKGFMTQADYERVVHEMRLADGTVWPIPVTLPAQADEVANLKPGDEIALVEPDDRVLAILELEEKFRYDKLTEAKEVYRTTDDAHPGVKRVYGQGDVLLGGPIHLLRMPGNLEFPEFRHTPAQTRRMFDRRGWRRVVGFQTRNPIHRAHEYIQKTALEIVDGLFVHPLVGETKPDDIPPDVRLESYQTLLRDYYPPERVILGVFPAAMRYAGPREAVFHALARRNYGCTHFIVGRDHAGVRGYYGTYDAHYIFDEFEPEEIGITPMFFDHAFFCRKCGGIVSAKTCPHDDSYHIVLSGTQVREMLERGEMLPSEFTRPEVSKVLIEGMRRRLRGLTGAKDEPEGTGEAPSFKPRKVFVIGLDCAEPSLVFDKWRDELPNLSRLLDQGAYGELESSTPPITVPAWSSMLSSRDPGQLGFYGFRNRADYSYDKMTIATSSAVRAPRVWDILGRAGKQVVVVGVPQTYPIRPVNGHLISSFLTPPGAKYTYPTDFATEVESLVGEYLVDVPHFRTDDKDYLLEQIYDMTEKRFTVLKHLMRTRPWDFFMFVEMGVDRIHHGFWKYHDPSHPKYVPGNPYENAIQDYYRYIDREIGEMVDSLDDDTVVMVISDHGAKSMDGGICFNEWLIQEGYLVLKDKPTEGIVPLEKCEVDWARTKAWGAGGYYGRLFLNVQGREPQGVIPARDYERTRDELTEKLIALQDHQGRVIPGTRVLKPQEVYREVNNIPPDLIVYFGDLRWRSVGSLGLNRIHTFENDTGPDDANHAQMGLYMFYDPRENLAGRVLQGMQLEDVAPTILDLMGLPVPREMEGEVIRHAS
ncbi:MAG: sulfate adenylyltransferase [Anaerolineae bacterium]